MKIIFVLIILPVNLIFSQKLDRIQLTSSNAIIIGSQINIKLEPLKNNKKRKVKVIFEDKNNYFTRRISADKYNKISQHILSIKEPVYTLGKDSLRSTCIDGYYTSITTFQGNVKKQYDMECMSFKDKNDNEKQYFWNAVKLIMESVRMKIESLY
ncbi:hypothetical protein [Chryseobacterium sp. Hurlbut01]|jgi:hypothetical protein|uniref:hypothetical protein n=1 Tax=Chryseobacterium sp. Hurlbut01 TaxID=1681828 RepID=UPI00067E149E|nr:hypothetical protein [Chryseobacterium sp. Hurlbut01]KNB62985.1 hypothetical protein AC804_02895 [Chryseobacterium sp. Hurlbut01]